MEADKKKISLWVLYDFANSIAVVVFFLYFSQWLVIENGVSDFWYNSIFVISSFLLVCTAPIGGAFADQIRVRMPFLRVLTILFFLSLLFTSLIANFAQDWFILGAILFVLANYFYQMSFVFYNPLLSDVAPPKSRGFISGLGQTGNWFGQIVGLLIAIPFITGAAHFIGLPGRVQTFLPATIIFFVLALPMLISFKEKAEYRPRRLNLAEEYRNFFASFKDLMKHRDVKFFLLGYFFFNDAILTALNNFPIYLEQVYQVSDSTKSFLLMGILFTSAIGAFVSGWISDKLGLKRTLLLILFGWMIGAPVLVLLKDFSHFAIGCIVLGFLFGSVWSVTRAVMTYLSPPDKLNYAFSFYTLAERFSTFVGPVAWGLITYFLVGYGPTRYRIAFLSMTVFIFIGFFIVRKIPEPHEVKHPALQNT